MVGQQGLLDIIEKHFRGYWFCIEALKPFLYDGYTNIPENLVKLTRAKVLLRTDSISKQSKRGFWLLVEEDE
jgi:hypothetical protein